MDWYRKKSWSLEDESDFFARLKRARKDIQAQYLKIQGIELATTDNPKLWTVAESLLIKVLSDYPDDRFNRSSSLHTLGEIEEKRGHTEKAMTWYKQALAFEATYPSVKTQADIDFAVLAAKSGSSSEYAYIKELFEHRIDTIVFPIEKYKINSVLAIIAHTTGDQSKAKAYADRAEEGANALTSGLSFHKDLGLVKQRDKQLDKLVKKAAGSSSPLDRLKSIITSAKVLRN
jgi:tetratricopeptide (TPR) repeat protein